MSVVLLELAEHALSQSAARSSREAVAAALLLAQVAWNRAVDLFGGDRTGEYRKVLEALRRENSGCLQELKSRDHEALISQLVELKNARHPDDRRIIHLCGLSETNTVRVEWRDDSTPQPNWRRRSPPIPVRVPARTWLRRGPQVASADLPGFGHQSRLSQPARTP